MVQLKSINRVLTPASLGYNLSYTFTRPFIGAQKKAPFITILGGPPCKNGTSKKETNGLFGFSMIFGTLTL